jgi:hypothetical protein
MAIIRLILRYITMAMPLISAFHAIYMLETSVGRGKWKYFLLPSGSPDSMLCA